MCIRPDYSRRYCLKCRCVTHWQLDRKIGHSRCIVCHSDSRKARKLIKNNYEEPKMNKQYVKEQIDIAVSELRKEYDAIIGNIYQCPDCGAVAFRNSTHICLSGKAEPVVPQTPKKQLLDYVMDVLPTIPPDISQTFEAESPYLPKGIGNNAVALGFPGKATSVGSNIGKFVAQSKGAIKQAPVAYREKARNKKGTEYERIIAGFAYWRSA